MRELLVEKQREMAKEGGVIMDGRDIGSVVFPSRGGEVLYDGKS